MLNKIIWNESVVACLKALFEHSSEKTEEDRLQSSWLVRGWTF
jgi:hypothetical protein